MENNDTSKRKLGDDLLRLLYMFLYFIAGRVVAILVCATAVVQFITVLFTDKPNVNIGNFGRSLSLFAAEMIQFLSYNTEMKPWPVSPWPGAGGEDTQSPEIHAD